MSQKKLTIKHHHPYILCHCPHIAGLFFQLPHRALRRTFPSVHQAGWDLNNDFVNWRPELFLQHNLWARRFGQNGDDSNTVYFRVGGTSLGQVLAFELGQWGRFGSLWQG